MRLISSLLQRGMGDWSKKYANLPESYLKRVMEQVKTVIKLFREQYSMRSYNIGSILSFCYQFKLYIVFINL